MFGRFHIWEVLFGESGAGAKEASQIVGVRIREGMIQALIQPLRKMVA